MQRRTVLAAAPLFCLLPRPAIARRWSRGGGGASGAGLISPDGSIVIGQPSGGGGTLYTAYGTWTLGSRGGPAPGFGGGTYCEVLLNGFPTAPGIGTGVIGPPFMQQLRVNFGGRLFGITFDQLWQEWSYYSWRGDGGADLASGPSGVPVHGPLPNYAPPYTPSPENTSVSGGTGSLTTIDGIWTFGAVNGTGWDISLNDSPTALFLPGSAAINLMTVYASGRLFFRNTASLWFYWAGNQPNASTGPTASPVPINSTISPSNPQLSHAPSIGTHVADVAVTMSNGSGFSGTITIDDTANFSIVGSSIFTNAALSSNFYIPTLTVTQNGGSFARIFDVNVA